MKGFRFPENSCDSHLHIIDPRFPNNGKASSQHGTLSEYREFIKDTGLSRAVFVQPKTFGTDNTCLLDAIEGFGSDNARGIAVVNDTVTDKELEYLDAHGVRGLRFSVWDPNDAVVSFDTAKTLSDRIKDMGWNIQIHMRASQILEYSPIINSIDGRIVIDHMGRPDPRMGTSDPAFTYILRMIDKGNTWVKLSGPYLNTAGGSDRSDADRIARALADYAPERVLWGSDFPHVTEKIKPSPEEIFDTAGRWFPNERAAKLALVDNPAEVYGF